MSVNTTTLTYDVTLPKFLWKHLHRLFEQGKGETNRLIRELWNEAGFSILKRKGEASAILKGVVKRPSYIPSRIFRNILECSGRIIRSQIKRKEIFEKLLKGENLKKNLLVENILRQIENLKKKGRKPDDYFQLSPPLFSGNIFLTSSDDSIENGQLKKLKVCKEHIELKIKLPVAFGRYRWFKAEIKTPERIRRTLLLGGKIKAPVLRRVKNKNNKYVYILSIPMEFKSDRRAYQEEKVLGIDLSPSVKRLAVGVIKGRKEESRPIYFKAERVVKKVLRIRKEISFLERKIDNIKNQLEETKSSDHKKKLHKRLKHLFSEQKLKQRKLKNIRKQILEILTKQIAEVAKLERVSLVAVERLKFKDFPEWKGKTFRWLFSSWFYSKFAERLEQKLRLSGIKLKQINPAYTSKRCHVCGSSLKGEGLYLFCENCKKKWDRDYNAAWNIANKGYISLFQKERKPKGLAPEGARELTVPSGSLLRSWSEIVEVKSAILQSLKELVSSVKKNGTVYSWYLRNKDCT
ncbi:MAG: transposase [Halomonas sp.]|nr:transposase [Halomonas sp.]MCD6439449.1 transposase [Halomonas sp.]